MAAARISFWDRKPREYRMLDEGAQPVSLEVMGYDGLWYQVALFGLDKDFTPVLRLTNFEHRMRVEDLSI